MVQVFALNLSWLSPAFLMVGVILHLGKKATRIGQIGRILRASRPEAWERTGIVGDRGDRTVNQMIAASVTSTITL